MNHQNEPIYTYFDNNGNFDIDGIFEILAHLDLQSTVEHIKNLEHSYQKQQLYVKKLSQEEKSNKLFKRIQEGYIYGVLSNNEDFIGFRKGIGREKNTIFQSGFTYVTEEYRKKGYGLALKENQIAFARHHAYISLYSSTTKEPFHNISAVKILEKTGHTLKEGKDGNIYGLLDLK